MGYSYYRLKRKISELGDGFEKAMNNAFKCGRCDFFTSVVKNEEFGVESGPCWKHKHADGFPKSVDEFDTCDSWERTVTHPITGGKHTIFCR